MNLKDISQIKTSTDRFYIKNLISKGWVLLDFKAFSLRRPLKKEDDLGHERYIESRSGNVVYKEFLKTPYTLGKPKE